MKKAYQMPSIDIYTFQIAKAFTTSSADPEDGLDFGDDESGE